MCGTPVIVTSKCCMRDIVKEAGFVVDLDHIELSKAIRILLNDDEQKKLFIEKGQQLVRERYTWDIVIDKILRVYESSPQPDRYHKLG